MLDLRQIDRDISLADADVKHRGPHLNLECKYLFTLHWLSEPRRVNLLALGDPAVAHGIDEFPTSAWRAAAMRSTVDAWTGVSRGPGGLSRDWSPVAFTCCNCTVTKICATINSSQFLSFHFVYSVLGFCQQSNSDQLLRHQSADLHGEMHAQFKPSVSAYSVGIGLNYSLDSILFLFCIL